MSFKFSFEKVLQHRKTLEDIAKREFAEAERKVQSCRDQLKYLYSQVDESRKQAEILARNGGACTVELSNIDDFLGGQQVRINHKRSELRELLAVSEERLATLVEKAKDKKILEKLKEKQLQEHKRLLKKRELKAQDDMNVMRAGKGWSV